MPLSTIHGTLHLLIEQVTTINTAYHPQAKYKQAREERKKLLAPAHMYMIDVLADRLMLEPTAVEDFILDSPSVSVSYGLCYGVSEYFIGLGLFCVDFDQSGR